MRRRLKALRYSFILLFTLSFLHIFAFAADDSGDNRDNLELQNPFSDYVPFEDERDIDEAERFMYFGRFFAISLGSGIHQFGGNIGKLYNTAVPVIDFRLLHFFDFRFAGQVGISSASHAFSAVPVGYVEVNLFRLNLDMKYYLDTKDLGAVVTAANPYLIAGASQTFRTQVFQDGDGSIQKDNAFAMSAGAGLEFTIKPRKTSLGVEGRVHQFFFKDRFAETYLQSGIQDTTGAMYSMITSIIFFF